MLSRKYTVARDGIVEGFKWDFKDFPIVYVIITAKGRHRLSGVREQWDARFVTAVVGAVDIFVSLPNQSYDLFLNSS